MVAALANPFKPDVGGKLLGDEEDHSQERQGQYEDDFQCHLCSLCSMYRLDLEESSMKRTCSNQLAGSSLMGE